LCLNWDIQKLIYWMSRIAALALGQLRQAGMSRSMLLEVREAAFGRSQKLSRKLEKFRHADHWRKFRAFQEREGCRAAEQPNRQDAKAAKASTAQGRPSAAEMVSTGAGKHRPAAGPGSGFDPVLSRAR
jgi:hypothetical protein